MQLKQLAFLKRQKNKSLVLSLLLMLAGIFQASAAIFEIRVAKETNGTLTFYLIDDYYKEKCTGETATLTVNGVDYIYTSDQLVDIVDGDVSSLPSTILPLNQNIGGSYCSYVKITGIPCVSRLQINITSRNFSCLQPFVSVPATIDNQILCSEIVGSQGCTPGYWKNHTGAWQVYSPTQRAETVFDLSDFPTLASKTLLQSIQGDGGSTLLGSATILLRAATAALLNAAQTGVKYPLLSTQIISLTNVALTSNNRDDMINLASKLDAYNNLNCPLGRVPVSATSLRPEAEIGEKEFAVSSYPNPSSNAFTLEISGNASEKVSLRVTDMLGRVVEQRNDLSANQAVQIGSNYSAGLYQIEVVQGKVKKQLKLVKSAK